MARFLALAAAGMLLAPAAQAVEVTGGSVALEYSGLIDSDTNDVNKATAKGSIEFGFDRAFSVQGDMAFTKFGLIDDSGNSLGLHAIWHLSDATSAGLYVGREEIDGHSNFYGLEMGHGFDRFAGEGYLGRVEDGDDHGTAFGLRGDYSISDMMKVGMRFDTLNIEGTDLSRLSLTGEMALADNFTLTGEVGSADYDSGGSQTFVGVGVKMNFGATRGATFQQRGILEMAPGL
ncbi:MAG: hypothetical protein QM656_08230 [Paracoccaceae bacterium]